MKWFYQLRVRLSHAGFLPCSRLALVAWYLLGLDIFLFLLQKISAVFSFSFGQSLVGWVSGLSLAVIVLLAMLAIRWTKARLLWRLRNRLIVTYIFIGVIPVVLLVVLVLGSFYLFAGQFATFIVTNGLDSELSSLDAATSATSESGVGGLLPAGKRDMKRSPEIQGLTRSWQMYTWLDGKPTSGSGSDGSAPPPLPAYLRMPFRGIVRDHGQLFLRIGKSVSLGSQTLTVLASEPLDRRLLEHLAANLGEVSLYTSGLTVRQVSERESDVSVSNLPAAATAGVVRPRAGRFDFPVTFATAISVMDWDTGAGTNQAGVYVRTRLSNLYDRLFTSLGVLAPAVEVLLLLVAVVFAIIELVALVIGIRLNRTITGAVALLYEATGHINRGEFSHRIPVQANDQLAALASSFNSMTASLEQLIQEQKEKQRMENELVIAQEVQAQLFPRHISQLSSLEVFGFCRPARTVSGDYYDFLAMDSEKLLLAVGDISGKGIAAALLMATIHSAVRAYSLEGIPILREPVVAGLASGSSLMIGSKIAGVEVSPAALLTLLNHQLYDSTPAEKYATLFLGVYDSRQRTLSYSNGGHLPPVILGNDRTLRKLDQGGTVVGLFDEQSYDEALVSLAPGDIFLAYSDGVTEPENDFGEFGEERLVELVWANRELALPKISELVTAAVDDWIGGAEQPDDVTLVLARAR